MRELSKLLSQYEKELDLVCDVKCRKPATRTVTVHRVDTCDMPDIMPSGNRTFTLCTQHALEVRRRIIGVVISMFETLPPQADWLECTSCGLIIRSYQDVFRIEDL